MKWDCYLPNANVDCVVLESSLTSKIPFLVVVPDATSADVVATVSSVPSENGTMYQIDLVGPPLEGDNARVHAHDKIPSSIDGGTATVRLLTKLERGLANFMDQKMAAEVTDGKLIIEAIDPVGLPFTGRPQQTGVKWYFAPSIGVYASDVKGVGVNASGSAAIAFNYSETFWRAQQSISANYNRQSQPVPGTLETASISFEGGNVTNVLSRALTKDNHWNAGLLLSAEKNPQANYAMRANASAGVEFDLIPRQTVNQKNLGARCAIGPEFQRYDTTNIEGLDRQFVGRQFCDVFLSWHFVPIDVWASLGETTVLKSFDFRAFSANLSATWRITDDLTFSPWVSVQQINKATDEARTSNVVETDPRAEIEASMLAAVRQGYTAPFGIQSGLSIRYLFGNGSLSSEDQRWKSVSNLR